MEIQSTTALNPVSTNASQETVINSDFETFLVMLTAQMENQDPLNPLDSQDFATQLATFSGVEQQVKTNELLENLAAQMVTADLAEMSRWVGMEARMAVPASFSGEPIEIVQNPPVFADSTDLVVRNSAGDVVQRVSIPVSDAPFFWDGKDTNGLEFPPGDYSFSVEAFSNGDVIDVHTPDIFARIAEVRTLQGQTIVVLESGALFPSSNVTGLR